MQPANPDDPNTQETESKKPTQPKELRRPFSSEDSPESDENNKPDIEGSTIHMSHDQTVDSTFWDSSAADMMKREKGKEEDEDKSTTAATKSEESVEDNSSGRERLKRHRVEVAGRVWIPDIWGQEDFLKDWIDCAAFDASLKSSSIARASLVEEGRRANPAKLRIKNGY